MHLPSAIPALAAALILTLSLGACGKKTSEQTVLQGETMGTTYTVKYLSDDLPNPPAPEAVKKQIDGALEEVNRQMSLESSLVKIIYNSSCQRIIRTDKGPSNIILLGKFD